MKKIMNDPVHFVDEMLQGILICASGSANDRRR